MYLFFKCEEEEMEYCLPLFSLDLDPGSTVPFVGKIFGVLSMLLLWLELFGINKSSSEISINTELLQEKEANINQWTNKTNLNQQTIRYEPKPFVSCATFTSGPELKLHEGNVGPVTGFPRMDNESGL